MLRIWVSEERRRRKKHKKLFPYSVLELLFFDIVLVHSRGAGTFWKGCKLILEFSIIGQDMTGSNVWKHGIE